jgi:gamma-glutamyl phosphate reductase
MEQDRLVDIINKAINSSRRNNYNHELELVNNLKISIEKNLDLFEKANYVDIENENGSKLDLDRLMKIFDNYTSEPLIFSRNDFYKNNNIIKSVEYDRLGIVLVLFNGDTYAMLEMIILGILTHNTLIFAYDSYNGGANKLLVDLTQSVFENEDLEKEAIDQYFTVNPEELFENYKTIDKTIIIGDHYYIDKYKKLCPTELVVSGYNHYDIYIESLDNIDLITKIISSSNNIDIYVTEELSGKIDGSIVVNDLEEAINMINYNSSLYCSSIFTGNSKNASIFLKNVKSKNVLYNASPLLINKLDIREEDLLKEKTIIIPNVK